MKIGDRGPDEYRRQLEAKLRPERIRATLSFAGLYQMTHEMIKAAVLDEVRDFYWNGAADGVASYDEQSYAANLLAKAPRDKFRASLLWLVDSEAITSSQADRLDGIYAHRHELSHELVKYIVDCGFEPDGALLNTSLSTSNDQPSTASTGCSTSDVAVSRCCQRRDGQAAVGRSCSLEGSRPGDLNP